MTVAWRGVAALPVAALLLTACQSGPQDLGDGSYRAFAVAAEIGAVPDADMTLQGDTISLTMDRQTTTASLAPGDDEYVVCPPQGEGTPLVMDSSVSIGGVTLLHPAVFGDCGQTTPHRITIIDLDSLDQSAGQPPFRRWIEFCDQADPDCP